jgi:hypothetical protein
LATYRLGRPLAYPRKNLVYLLTACAVPIHVWSIIVLLYEIPGWMLRLNIWDLAGVAAYTMVYALAETLLFAMPVVVLNLMLALAVPRPNGFVAHSALAILLTGAWIVTANSTLDVLRAWGGLQVVAGLGLYLASILAAFFAVQRLPRLEAAILSILDRLVVLAFLYLAIDLVSLLVVLVRNV